MLMHGVLMDLFVTFVNIDNSISLKYIPKKSEPYYLSHYCHTFNKWSDCLSQQWTEYKLLHYQNVMPGV